MRSASDHRETKMSLPYPGSGSKTRSRQSAGLYQQTIPLRMSDRERNRRASRSFVVGEQAASAMGKFNTAASERARTSESGGILRAARLSHLFSPAMKETPRTNLGNLLQAGEEKSPAEKTVILSEPSVSSHLQGPSSARYSGQRVSVSPISNASLGSDDEDESESQKAGPVRRSTRRSFHLQAAKLVVDAQQDQGTNATSLELQPFASKGVMDQSVSVSPLHSPDNRGESREGKLPKNLIPRPQRRSFHFTMPENESSSRNNETDQHHELPQENDSSDNINSEEHETVPESSRIRNMSEGRQNSYSPELRLGRSSGAAKTPGMVIEDTSLVIAGGTGVVEFDSSLGQTRGISPTIPVLSSTRRSGVSRLVTPAADDLPILTTPGTPQDIPITGEQEEVEKDKADAEKLRDDELDSPVEEENTDGESEDDIISDKQQQQSIGKGYRSSKRLSDDSRESSLTAEPNKEKHQLQVGEERTDETRGRQVLVQNIAGTDGSLDREDNFLENPEDEISHQVDQDSDRGSKMTNQSVINGEEVSEQNDVDALEERTDWNGQPQEDNNMASKTSATRRSNATMGGEESEDHRTSNQTHETEVEGEVAMDSGESNNDSLVFVNPTSVYDTSKDKVANNRQRNSSQSTVKNGSTNALSVRNRTLSGTKRASTAAPDILSTSRKLVKVAPARGGASSSRREVMNSSSRSLNHYKRQERRQPVAARSDVRTHQSHTSHWVQSAAPAGYIDGIIKSVVTRCTVAALGTVLRRWGRLSDEELTGRLLVGQKSQVCANLQDVAKRDQHTREIAGDLELTYVQLMSSKKHWRVFRLTGDSTKVDVDPRTLKSKLVKSLQMKMTHGIVDGNMSLYAGALWFRLHLQTKQTRKRKAGLSARQQEKQVYDPNSSVFLLVFPGTPIVIISRVSITVHRMVVQVLKEVTRADRIVDTHLSGQHVSSLADLALRTQKQPDDKYRELEKKENPHLSTATKRKSSEEGPAPGDSSHILDELRPEKRHRSEILTSVFGAGPHPVLEKLEYKFNVSYKDPHSPTTPQCKALVEIKGKDVLSGLVKVAKEGYIKFPLSRHLRSVVSMSQNSFTLKNNTSANVPRN